MNFLQRNIGPLAFWTGVAIVCYTFGGSKGLGLALIAFGIVCAL